MFMQASNDIVLMYVIGIAMMLLLIAGVFIVFLINQRKKLQYQSSVQKLHEQQQNQLIEAAVKSEESERHRIAEQLHDEVGAILSSTKLHFSNINATQLDTQGQALHERSKELLDESIQKIRSISHNLHSTLLKEFGLNEAIKHFLKKTVTGTLVKVNTDLDPGHTARNQLTDLGIYRILQELVNNILKHANATELSVTSKLSEKLLTLEIIHNGAGLSHEEFEQLRFNPSGLGLKNIQNRIILLKGNIRFERSANENKITLSIPTIEES